MSKTIEDLKVRFWKDALESKGSIPEKRVIVSRLEGEPFKSKIDLCGVCGRRVMANSVLCTKCGNWAHGRCAKIKRVTARLAVRCVCLKYEGIMEETVDLIEK